MFEYILKTENPDCELEYIWLSLKNHCSKYTNKSQTKEINELSHELNTLQINKNYELIKNKIGKFLENKLFHQILKNIICHKDYKCLHYVNILIKKWHKIDKLPFFDKETFVVFYCSLFLDRKNVKDEIRDECIEYIIMFIKTKDIKQLEIFAKVALKHNMVSIIDKLRTIVNVNIFFDFNVENMSSQKLCQKFV